MRLDINLASQPYEDARSFWMRAGTALALAILLTIGLAAVLVQQMRSTTQINARLDAVKRDLNTLQRESEHSRAILNRPENQGTREQSQFVNGLLARRAFSWTQVFADLEKLMPTRVHVVSINPELNQDNQLAIKLKVAGDSRERAIDLVHNLETARHFRSPRIVSETNKPGGGTSDIIQFEVEAVYVPDLPTARPSPVEVSRR